MNDYQKAKLIQEEYDARQKTWGASDGFRGNQTVSGKNLHLPTQNMIDGSVIEVKKTPKTPLTRTIVAKEHNITEGMVYLCN